MTASSQEWLFSFYQSVPLSVAIQLYWWIRTSTPKKELNRAGREGKIAHLLYAFVELSKRIPFLPLNCAKIQWISILWNSHLSLLRETEHPLSAYVFKEFLCPFVFCKFVTTKQWLSFDLSPLKYTIIILIW